MVGYKDVRSVLIFGVMLGQPILWAAVSLERDITGWRLARWAA